jgi:hypothetical protein
MAYETFELRFEGCELRDRSHFFTIRMTPSVSFAILNCVTFRPAESAQNV